MSVFSFSGYLASASGAPDKVTVGYVIMYLGKYIHLVVWKVVMGLGRRDSAYKSEFGKPLANSAWVLIEYCLLAYMSVGPCLTKSTVQKKAASGHKRLSNV
jgi:hypothetical protein